MTAGELKLQYDRGLISRIAYKKALKRLMMSERGHTYFNRPEAVCPLKQPVQLTTSMNGICFPCAEHGEHFVIVT